MFLQVYPSGTDIFLVLGTIVAAARLSMMLGYLLFSLYYLAQLSFGCTGLRDAGSSYVMHCSGHMPGR